MDIPLGHYDGAVSSRHHNLVNIARFISKAGQKRVPQRVQNKRSHFRQSQGFTVLLLHRVWLNVSAFGWCGPHPPLRWFPSRFPSAFEDLSDSWDHVELPSCSFRLSAIDHEGS